MEVEGNILKMRTEFSIPVRYYLPVGDQEIEMNSLLEKEIEMQFTGRINCISCGKITKTSFGQGFCYSCMQTAPEASESVVRPELSKAEFGIARNIIWAKEHDLIDHFVYMAISSDLKVGVTRHHQIPSRWIDQGANMAIKLAKAPNRHIAGIIEVFLKQYYADKTNWKSMLKNSTEQNTDLIEEKNKAIGLLPTELKKYRHGDDEITTIEYPVIKYPDNIKSINLDKTPVIKGLLTGIKGQYLIFNDNMVINIRKHNGYYIKVLY
jgi:hypothetical protein